VNTLKNSKAWFLALLVLSSSAAIAGPIVWISTDFYHFAGGGTDGGVPGVGYDQTGTSFANPALAGGITFNSFGNVPGANGRSSGVITANDSFFAIQAHITAESDQGFIADSGIILQYRFLLDSPRMGNLTYTQGGTFNEERVVLDGISSGISTYANGGPTYLPAGEYLINVFLRSTAYGASYGKPNVRIQFSVPDTGTTLTFFAGALGLMIAFRRRAGA
jgi:hypothetical protein